MIYCNCNHIIQVTMSKNIFETRQVFLYSNAFVYLSELIHCYYQSLGGEGVNGSKLYHSIFNCFPNSCQDRAACMRLRNQLHWEISFIFTHQPTVTNCKHTHVHIN